MLFSSITFIFVFLPIVVSLYYLARKELRNYILLGASVLFYAWGEPKYFLVMMLVVAANFFSALLMDRFQRLRKLFVTLAILVNFGVLGYFKYTDFLIENLNLLFRSGIDPIKVVMPIGISFYIFQSVSYLIDVYRREIPAQRDFFKLFLFIALFPQMIAGPILKYHDVADQIAHREFQFEHFAYGVKRFIIGLSKKMLIANVMGAVADRIFEANGIHYPFWMTWVGALAYTFQIYYDFSGYSDMAIGLGAIFGFRFLENFNYPYISRTITEFWRRWHISLSTWFKEEPQSVQPVRRFRRHRRLARRQLEFRGLGPVARLFHHSGKTDRSAQKGVVPLGPLLLSPVYHSGFPLRLGAVPREHADRRLDLHQTHVRDHQGEPDPAALAELHQLRRTGGLRRGNSVCLPRIPEDDRDAAARRRGLFRPAETLESHPRRSVADRTVRAVGHENCHIHLQSFHLLPFLRPCPKYWAQKNLPRKILPGAGSDLMRKAAQRLPVSRR